MFFENTKILCDEIIEEPNSGEDTACDTAGAKMDQELKEKEAKFWAVLKDFNNEPISSFHPTESEDESIASQDPIQKISLS